MLSQVVPGVASFSLSIRGLVPKKMSVLSGCLRNPASASECMVLMGCDAGRSWPAYVGDLMSVPCDFCRFACADSEILQAGAERSGHLGRDWWWSLLVSGGAFRKLERVVGVVVPPPPPRRRRTTTSTITTTMPTAAAAAPAPAPAAAATTTTATTTAATASATATTTTATTGYH